MNCSSILSVKAIAVLSLPLKLSLEATLAFFLERNLLALLFVWIVVSQNQISFEVVGLKNILKANLCFFGRVYFELVVAGKSMGGDLAETNLL